jgi:hypothetical protein
VDATKGLRKKTGPVDERRRPSANSHFRNPTFVPFRVFVVSNRLNLCAFASLREIFSSLLLSRIDPDRDRAIIDELDRHMRTENSSLNGFFEQHIEFLAKIGVHALRKLRGRRSNKGGAITFLSTSKQRELGHNQRLAANVRHGLIHRPRRVRKNPQASDFARKPLDIFASVGRFDPQKDQDTNANLANRFVVYNHRSLANALDKGAHGTRISGARLACEAEGVEARKQMRSLVEVRSTEKM